MRNKQNRFTTRPKLQDALEAFLTEPAISDTQYFVDDENIRVNFRGHRERQPHVHAGRVLLNR